MNEENFIKGNISTEYLEKFDLIKKMEEDGKKKIAKLADSSVAGRIDPD